MKCKFCGAEMVEVDISYDMDYSEISYQCPVDHTGIISPEAERAIYEADGDWSLSYDNQTMWATAPWVLLQFGFNYIVPDNGNYRGYKDPSQAPEITKQDFEYWLYSIGIDVSIDTVEGNVATVKIKSETCEETLRFIFGHEVEAKVVWDAFEVPAESTSQTSSSATRIIQT